MLPSLPQKEQAYTSLYRQTKRKSYRNEVYVNFDLLGIKGVYFVQGVDGLKGGYNIPVFHNFLAGLYNLFVHTVDIYSELCECPYL